MSVQDDKPAAQEDDRTHDDDRAQEDDQARTEKPEPDEDDKQKASEMMEAYKEKPTLVLPGTGGSVSGTAINDWLDDEGNPKFEVPEEAGSDAKAKAEEARDDKDLKEKIEKDKALNEELKKAASQENKGEKGSSSK